jgi:hypothetical protein
MDVKSEWNRHYALVELPASTLEEMGNYPQNANSSFY